MAKRRSSSYPIQFHKLLIHVATTQKPLTIDNLENRKSAYTSFRARVNEYRKLYNDEAEQEGDTARIEISAMMYGVVLSDPQEIEGKWQCMVRPQGYELGRKLDELLADLPDLVPLTEPVAETKAEDNVDKAVEEAQEQILKIFKKSEKRK